ncbi:hypothetical protein [Intrasporangium sp. DVR]|uniref:hypothetical protein n=1 Tax=Intrasporangium sp. DVR TaxID=3127867 RepID=UPI00313A6844
MKRALVTSVCATLLITGAITAAHADDPVSTNQFADTGLPEKAAMEAQDALLHQALEAKAASPDAAAAEVAAKQAAAGPAAADPAAAAASWEEGLFTSPEAPPASSADFAASTLWVGHLSSGDQVAIYAGQHGPDSSQGRVLLAHSGPDGNLASAMTIDIPGAHALRITTADSTGVVVTDASGGTWTIDPVTGSVR